jgi:hypothetical protein
MRKYSSAEPQNTPSRVLNLKYSKNTKDGIISLSKKIKSWI